jgi:hypothetical protein
VTDSPNAFDTPTARRRRRLLTAAVGVLTASVAIRTASFAATITDVSSYVTEGRGWGRGDLFSPFGFSFWPDWPAAFSVPLGLLARGDGGATVPITAPGLPWLIALATWIGGPVAAYLVVPVMTALLVVVTGELARLVGGARAVVPAALMMASSPILMQMTQQPMSDVPATLWTTAALVLAHRSTLTGTLAAGAAMSMAIATRPFSVLLTPVPLVLVAWLPRGRWQRAASFLVPLAVMGGVMLWTNAALYGSASDTGYGSLGPLFTVGNIPVNFRQFVGWFVESHSLLLVAGAAFVAARRPTPLVVALAAFALLNLLIYLPYRPFPDWHFLRFLLPALPPLCALAATAAVTLTDSVTPRLRAATVAVVVLAVVGQQAYSTFAQRIHLNWKWDRKILLAGEYLAASLPRNALVVTFFHSGSVAHYAGLPILRPDIVPAPALDGAVTRLERAGHRVYLLIDHDMERGGFEAKFAGSSRLGRLDWRPRAEIGEFGRLTLYAVTDRDVPADEARWPIDVVR